MILKVDHKLCSLSITRI